jgi:hypothetical protein
LPLEVYNLGKPGGDPDDYLEIARSFISWMKPKYVVISVSQGDDLAQILERDALARALERRPGENAERGPANQLVAWARDAAAINLRGLTSAVRAMRRMSQGPELLATEGWRDLGARFLSDEEARLPPDIREMLLSGDLNPALVFLAAKRPRRMVRAYQSRHSDRIRSRLTRIVKEIEELAVASGGKAVLMSMPVGIYYESTIRSNYGRMGFDLPATDSCRADGLIEDVARRLGIPAVVPGAELRRREDLDGLWFAYDGHLTPFGNEVIGRVVAQALVQLEAGGSISSSQTCVDR